MSLLFTSFIIVLCKCHKDTGRHQALNLYDGLFHYLYEPSCIMCPFMNKRQCQHCLRHWQTNPKKKEKTTQKMHFTAFFLNLPPIFICSSLPAKPTYQLSRYFYIVDIVAHTVKCPWIFTSIVNVNNWQIDRRIVYSISQSNININEKLDLEKKYM